MLRDPLSNDASFQNPDEITSGIQREINSNLMAVASLIIGIFSLFSRMEFLPELLAIILGACSRKKCDRKWIATTGIICGSITLFFYLILAFTFRQVGHPGP